MSVKRETFPLPSMYVFLSQIASVKGGDFERGKANSFHSEFSYVSIRRSATLKCWTPPDTREITSDRASSRAVVIIMLSSCLVISGRKKKLTNPPGRDERAAHGHPPPQVHLIGAPLTTLLTTGPLLVARAFPSHWASPVPGAVLRSADSFSHTFLFGLSCSSGAPSS